MSNWIPDRNVCGLAPPPAWWLTELWHFDHDLVVIPSRDQPYHYRLARRVRRSPGIPIKLIDKPEGDLAMMATHRLVPVTTLFHCGPIWTIDTLLASLRSRDVWRHGGAKKVADQLDQQDADDAAHLDRRISQDADAHARDAWRSYQARTGQRVVHSGLSSGRTVPSDTARQPA